VEEKVFHFKKAAQKKEKLFAWQKWRIVIFFFLGLFRSENVNFAAR
jgi:hypothetical protein